MAERTLILVFVAVVLGGPLGFVIATGMSPIAGGFGLVFGAFVGLLCSPIHVFCLRRKNLAVSLPLVWSPTTIVGLVSIGAKEPVWSMFASAVTLCVSCFLAAVLLSDAWAFYPIGHCQKCGYDLQGNTTGRCSECGVDVQQCAESLKSVFRPRKDGTQSGARQILFAMAFFLAPLLLASLTWPQIAERRTPSTVSELIERLGHNDMELSNKARMALIEKGKGPLLIALVHQNPSVRANAAEALGQLGDVSTVPDLLYALNDAYKHTRMRAAYALGTIGDRSAIPALIDLLADPDPNVRAYTMKALTRLNAANALEKVVGQLGDPSAYVVREAIRTVADLGDAQVIPKLVSLLKDARPYVRDQTILAIAKLDGQPTITGAWKDRCRAAWDWWEREGRARYDPE